MFVLAMLLHMRSQLRQVVEHLAADVTGNTFRFQVDNIIVRLEVVFLVKSFFTAFSITLELRFIMNLHMIFEELQILERLATLFTIEVIP